MAYARWLFLEVTFGKFRRDEIRRISLPHTLVNEGKKKEGPGCVSPRPFVT
jgi:hypothetical protein